MKALINDLFRHGNDFLRVIEEAQRLDIAHHLAAGWEKNGDTWTHPEGKEFTDGPGSILSLTRFVSKAAKNLDVDISQWGDVASKVKTWLAGMRK